MGRLRVLPYAALYIAVCIFPVQSLFAQSTSAQPVPAQSAAADGITVQTLVTVEPRHGSSPPVINRGDVMVREGKDRDTVTEWVPAEGDHSALELFILLDDSSNMTVGSQFEDIRRFILGQPDSAKVGLAYMQNGMARIVQNPTNDHQQVAKALRLPMGTPGLNGSPYFALSDLVKHWPTGALRRELVVVSDGIDRYYESTDDFDPYLDAAIDDAQRAGVIVCAIYTPGAGHFGHSYYRTYWGQLYLAKLAEKTGGEAYYIGMTGPPVTFAPYLDDVAQRLSHQYLLTFLAQPPKKAELQQIKITTEVNNADLVAPEKIFVPGNK